MHDRDRSQTPALTNARQIKRVYQPLIDRHPDLVQVDTHWLCIKPVRHTLLRVIVDRTSIGDCCNPQWSIQSTFVYGSELEASLGYWWWIKRPLVRLERDWRWSDPTMIEELTCIIETEALPLLRALDTYEKYAAFYRAEPSFLAREWNYDRMLIDIALGDLESARRILHALPARYREKPPADDIFIRNRWTRVTTVAEPLLADDRAALAAILHGWEADNVRRAGYERYWEPTPFPLERTG